MAARKKTNFPRIKISSNLAERLLPVFVIGIIGLSFVVGVLWEKVRNLEGSGGAKVAAAANNAPAAAQARTPLEDTDLKKYAKEIGLNENNFNNCLDTAKFATAVKDDTASGEKLGVSGTPAFFVNGHMISGAYPYQTFKEAIDFELSGGNWNNAPASLTSVGKTKVNVDLGNAPVEGSANAKVTIVEFSDFQCPFCGNFYSQTLGQIRNDYVKAGKVKIVYKQFPLISIHPYAQKAAEASLCAKDQGKFWEYHDKVFTTMTGS